MDYLQDYIQICAAFKELEKEGKAYWSLSDVEKVLTYFFKVRKQYINKPHPHLRKETYRNIIEKLQDDNFEPDYYQELIEQYFRTDFGNGCDYSLVHFTSGDIIAYRALEVGLVDSIYSLEFM